MDTSPSEFDLRDMALRWCAQSGPHFALHSLNPWLAGVEESELPEQLKSLRSTLEAAALSARDFDFLFLQAMAAKGMKAPFEIFRSAGFPESSFMVRVKFNNGRLGDCLTQLAVLLHAQAVDNLMLIVNAWFSEGTHIMTPALQFDGSLPSIDYLCVQDYLTTRTQSNPFQRSLLQQCSRGILGRITSDCPIDNDVLADALVLHVRAGDALFDGSIALPPLHYYTHCITVSSPCSVIVLAEPPSGNPSRNGDNLDPATMGILAFCKQQGIACSVISNHDMFIDASILYRAHVVVASTSSFSKMIPLYGHSCAKLFIPSSTGHPWINDTSIEYVDCWEDFNQSLWQSDLEYRLSWVSRDTLIGNNAECDRAKPK